MFCIKLAGMILGAVQGVDPTHFKSYIYWSQAILGSFRFCFPRCPGREKSPPLARRMREDSRNKHSLWELPPAECPRADISTTSSLLTFRKLSVAPLSYCAFGNWGEKGKCTWWILILFYGARSNNLGFKWTILITLIICHFNTSCVAVSCLESNGWSVP